MKSRDQNVDFIVSGWWTARGESLFRMDAFRT